MKILILIGLLIPAGIAFSQVSKSTDEPVKLKKVESKRFIAATSRSSAQKAAAQEGMSKKFSEKVRKHEMREIKKVE
jgi:hypothetical protein